MLDLILDLFGKAKKKILKQDDIPETFPNAIPQDKRRSPEIIWGPQEIGIAIDTCESKLSSTRNSFLIKVPKQSNLAF